MRYPDRDHYLYDHDPGTGIFPVIRQAPGRHDAPYTGDECRDASTPGHYGQPGGYAAGFPGTSAAGPAREHPAGRERLARMRPDRWVIAIGSITGAVAVYVALTTAGIPARPMPSPFTPATTQSGAPAHPASKSPVTCVTSGP